MPGALDIDVDPWDFQELPPGAYGTLRVEGTLFLAGGQYSFSSVTVGDGGRILADPSGADVRIAESLSTGWGATISPDDHDAHGQPCETSAAQLAISVAGADGSCWLPAVAIGPQSTMTARMTAPNGTLSLGDDVVATGAFAGFDVSVGDRCVVTFETGLSAPPSGENMLTSYTLPAASPLVGIVPPTTSVEVDLGLPLQNLAALAAIVAQASDPASASYRQWVNPSDFMANYAALSR
jgi:hypothetical protein